MTVAAATTAAPLANAAAATIAVPPVNAVANTGPASGTVTVMESLPTGLTLASMFGAGWTCPPGGTACERSDALASGSSYPPIFVFVNVAANAPSSVTNAVSVSGGGAVGASTTDTTAILPLPKLQLGVTHLGNFTQGQTGAARYATA